MVRYNPWLKKYQLYSVNRYDPNTNPNPIFINEGVVNDYDPKTFYFDEIKQEWVERFITSTLNGKLDEIDENDDYPLDWAEGEKSNLDYYKKYYSNGVPIYFIERYEGGRETDFLNFIVNDKKFTRAIGGKIPDDISVTPSGRITKRFKGSCVEMDNFTLGDYADMFHVSIDIENRNVPVKNYCIKCHPTTNEPTLEPKIQNTLSSAALLLSQLSSKQNKQNK